MKPEERRNEILMRLKKADGPTSASSLARELDVSRQIIVGDVAILRAEGEQIMATPRGYVLGGDITGDYGYVGTVAVQHGPERTVEELYTIVDCGGTAIDVTIDHPVYGQLSGPLALSSRLDVDRFAKKVQGNPSFLLSDLTDGIHTHRIGCRDEKTFREIRSQLEEKGFIL
ncbi:MAG: transcription repressor NadR [Anaerovoracaceae bacterium]|nr:transcription repressor NadR [Anaerovoracaceae bacterium]